MSSPGMNLTFITSKPYIGKAACNHWPMYMVLLYNLAPNRYIKLPLFLTRESKTFWVLKNEPEWCKQDEWVRHPQLILPFQHHQFSPFVDKSDFVGAAGFSTIHQGTQKESGPPGTLGNKHTDFSPGCGLEVAHELALAPLGHNLGATGEQ